MKKIVAAVGLLLAIAAPSFGADTVTTRLGLTIITSGSTLWGPKVNTNFSIADSSVAGQFVTNTFTSSNTFRAPVEHSSTTVVINGTGAGLYNSGPSTAAYHYGNGYGLTNLTGANVTGNISGNAGTATALAADPADAASGFLCLGINASGTCQPAWIETAATSVSTNPVTSGAMFTALAGKAPLTGGGTSGTWPITAANVTTNANLTGGVTSVGNAATVVTNANLTGNVTSIGNATTIAVIPAVSGASLTNLTGANVTGSVPKATNVTGGGVGQIPYQSAADTTLFMPAMALGGMISGNGTSAIPSTGTFTGTANQVIITRTGSNIVLSTPQDIQSGASPVFSGTNFTNLPSASGGVSWSKYTKTNADFSAAALTNTITLVALPAKSIVHGVTIKHSTAFSGTGITAYTISVGTGAGAGSSIYASAYDVFQAASSSASQVSSSLSTEGSAIYNLTATATSVGANLNAASGAGSVDIWVLLSTLP